MATKKAGAKNTGKQKTTMIKIAEKIGELAGEASVKKDQLVDMASGAMKTVRSTINNIAAKKKAGPKKTAQAVVKKVAKKVVRPAAKKITKAAKEITKAAAVKKSTTIKKSGRRL